MAYQSLLLGILFSAGLFALKTGAGLHYLLGRTQRLKIRIGIGVVLYGGYLLLFLAAGIFSEVLDLSTRFRWVLRASRHMMGIHFLLSVLTAVWAVVLLKGPSRRTSGSLGWLPMVLPCPVCLTVVWMTVGALYVFFPEAARPATLAAWGLFVLISIGATWVSGAVRKRIALSAEALLGAAMLAISAYFFLSVLIMPGFADLDPVFGIAVYSERTRPAADNGWLIWGAAAAVFFMTGFLTMRRTIKRRVSCRLPLC